MSLITAPSPALLVSERGGPVPPPAIVAALKRLDPALGLRFIAKFDQSDWAVTWEWRENDPRWARVKSQEIPRESAYDIVGYLPVGCSVDQARPYVEAHLKAYPKEEISRIRSRITHWNESEVPQQQVSALVADTMDDVARQQRAPKGQLFSFGTRKKS